MASIENPEDAFRPMLGQLVWSVRRGYGTFLTMEFGSPHLTVREPIVAASNADAKVKRNLAARRVSLVGDWHFWVEYANWEIKTDNYTIRSEDATLAPIKEGLNELDGQILLSADVAQLDHSCLLKFDLGASLHIWPGSEIEDNQWSIYEFDRDILSYKADGTLILEKSSGTV